MSLKWAVAAVVVAACGGGPDHAIVTNVVDGDTIDLDSGVRIRYILVDTPESTNGATDCFGQNAKTFNTDLVLNKEVELTYDVEREDRFGRTLAYVSVGEVDVNATLVDRGYGCVLFIPPDGEARHDEFEALEATAKAEGRGMWGQCAVVTCE